MSAYRPIWNDATIKILIDNWGTLLPHEIRELIIENRKAWAKETGRNHYQIPSIGGVLWKAKDNRLINDDEYIAIYKVYQRRQLSPGKRQRIINRDGGRCLVCFSKANLEVDHIVPVFSGGKDDDDNLQTLCKRCHRVKGMNQIDCRRIEYAAEYEKMDGGEIAFYPGVNGAYAGMAAAIELSAIRMKAALDGAHRD